MGKILLPIPTTDQNEHKWFHRFLDLQLAHDGIMIDDAQKVLAQQRQLTAAHAEVRGLTEGSLATEDAMVHIGDQVTNHIQQNQPQLGKLAKAALAAGLIATGAGAGIGVPLLLDALRKPQPTITAPSKGFNVEILNPDQ